MTRGPGLNQTVRGGALAALDLLTLAAAGAAAAVFMWAILEPAPSSPSGVSGEPGSSLIDRPLVLHGKDPFFRGPTVLAGASPSASAQGFVLHATRVAGDNSTAIISAQGLPQAAYRVGDTIGGARLADVTHDQVVIERDGERLTIAFPPSQGFMTQGGGAATPSEAGIPGLGLSPVAGDGRSNGYQVDGNNGVLLAAGFVAGDIILDVNGASVSPEALQSLQARLASGESAEIRFERNGQTMTKRIEGSAQ